ncbi:alpha/beta hydrolase [Mesobacillus harenae]|uniref:alpha/beta hydrolase n=1 Tax=Mesobacillus harenae TaxID=2213203 RepID=UPI00157FCAF4|nr:alpha/beta hydrolase [Mesobacillus harenae]
MASEESLIARKRLIEHVASQKPGGTLEDARQGLETLMSTFPVAQDIKVENLLVEGMPAEWVVAPNAVEDRVFLYLHGGAYIMGNCNTHRDLASKLSRATASHVLVVEYRLAPEHPFPAGIEDAVTAYRWLISAGVSAEKIIVGGDSAGGGLTLALLQSLREAGESLPALTVLLSPWTDMEGTGESMESRAAADPWLNPLETRGAPVLYLGETDPRNALVSPIHADLSGLPPMIVHVGNDEILLDDSVRLVTRARDAGVDATLKVWEGMWHVFQQFGTPESANSLEEIGQFVQQRLAANSASPAK